MHCNWSVFSYVFHISKNVGEDKESGIKLQLSVIFVIDVPNLFSQTSLFCRHYKIKLQSEL